VTRLIARLLPLSADSLGSEQRDILRGKLRSADRYLSDEPDAPPLPAILGLLAHHPGIAGPWLALSSALLDEPVLDARLRELVVLRVGWLTQCRYIWSQHVRMGLATGLSMTDVVAVGAPLDARWGEFELTALDAVDQLVATQTLDDSTWAALSDRFGEQQLVELLFVIGSWVCLAMVLNSVELEPEAAADDVDVALPPREV
jgi:4-carboxymuconolactone decarboxylase